MYLIERASVMAMYRPSSPVPRPLVSFAYCSEPSIASLPVPQRLCFLSMQYYKNAPGSQERVVLVPCYLLCILSCIPLALAFIWPVVLPLDLVPSYGNCQVSHSRHG